MNILLWFGHLFGSVLIAVLAYYWSAPFKKLGQSSLEELNPEELPEHRINESETTFINYLGKIGFLVLGSLIWMYLGISIGRVASELNIYTQNQVVEGLGYFLLYFIFLRFPFRVANRLIKDAHQITFTLEKIPFAIIMIASYAYSICYFDSLPQFLKWHLVLFN